VSEASAFIDRAAERYIDDTRETLVWILSRLPPGAAGAATPVFIDTKVNPLTYEDYTRADALRGPQYVYDWIQGRGLEAMCTHAAFFEPCDPRLAAELAVAIGRVRAALDEAVTAQGEAAFCRGPDGVARIAAGEGAGRARRRAPGLRCYGDIFVNKGLIAAAWRQRDDVALAHQLAVLADIVDAVDEGRFLLDERHDMSAADLVGQPDDLGPRMILLGAGALLRRLGLDAHDDFSERFLAHVLEHHLDRRSGLLADTPGGTSCNVGHGIELVGLAFETLRGRLTAAQERTLCEVLIAHANAGLSSPGIALTVDVPTGTPSSRYRPWWSLPETIRAASLGLEASGRSELLSIWRCVDADYFEHYRRPLLPIAYQTLTIDGPVDHVPATPDLDPAYHTGLSLLAAVECVHRFAARVEPYTPFRTSVTAGI